jgi:hypothetical protein
MEQSAISPFDFQEVEEEIRIELDLLDHEESKIAGLEKQITTLYRTIDPEGYLMAPQGIGPTIAPAILGIIGDVSRFPNIDSFRAYFGFVPKKRQSSSREKKGMGIHKAAQGLLKKYLFLAAEVARQYDPEFAAFYERLMNRAEGSRYVSSSGIIQSAQLLQPQEVGYKLRDLDGQIIDKRKHEESLGISFPANLNEKRTPQRQEI